MITDDFICVPFNMLRSEELGKNPYLSREVAEERRLIEKLIIGKSDAEIFNSPEAMEIICRLGSDLNINAFALNWKHRDGTLNTDLEEANYFMKNIVDRLSITTADTDPTEIPIFLTSTQFSNADYGECAQAFMKRIGLTQSKHNLFVLRNVVMSPFPTQMNFLNGLMEDFQKVILEEVQVSRERNTPGKHKIQFLVQGSPQHSKVFLVFQTSFHNATRRQQIVLSATFDQTLQQEYKSLREGGQERIAILESIEPLSIEEVVGSIGTNGASFQAVIHELGKEPESIRSPGIKDVMESIGKGPSSLHGMIHGMAAKYVSNEPGDKEES